ncbi:mas-related G-protein coupled receptor member X1-like [Geothlypis trichas]
MEVTTVSPSPASPTEGDDLCETDVTSVAIHSVTLLICLCGLPGNGAVIGLLGLKIRDYGIFSLAVIDFLFLLFAFPSTLLFLVEDVSCSPIMPLLYLNFLFQLSVLPLYWGLFWLMPSSIVLFMYKLCWLCCHRELPERLEWVLDTVQSWAFFALFTVFPTGTYLCPSHEQEYCRVPLISMYTLSLLLFVAPTLISSTADFIKAKWGSQQQQPERRDIVIFLIVLFIFLFNLCNFLQELGYITVSSEVVFLLTCINSSIKPFIYFLAGGCRRPCSVRSLWLSLQMVFDEPENSDYEPEHIYKSIDYEPKHIYENIDYEPEHIYESIDYEPKHIYKNIDYEPKYIYENIDYEPEHIYKNIDYEPKHIYENIDYEPEHIYDEPENIDYEPENSGYEPENRDYEPGDSDHGPENSDNEHEDSDHEPEDSDYEPEDSDHEPENRDYEPEDSDYEPENRDYEPEDSDHEPENRDYEPEDSDYEPENSDHEPEDSDYEPENSDANSDDAAMDTGV